MISRPVARQLALWCLCTSALLALAAPVRAARLSFDIPIPSDPASVTPDAGSDRLEVSGKEWILPNQPGAAKLPYRTVRVVLPRGEEVSDFSFTFDGKTVVSKSFRPGTVDRLATSEGDIADTRQATRETSQRVEYLSTGTTNGYQIATFAVYPFGLEAGVLRRAESVELRIDTRPLATSVVDRIRHRDGWREAMRERVAATVINPQALSAYAFAEIVVPDVDGGFTASTFPSLEGSPVDYVIVTNDSLAAAYQVLADWKTSKGVPTVVRTTEWIAANYRNGSDAAETIRNFIQDAYSLWGIKYALLGGDARQIPVRMAFSVFYPVNVGRANPADMYFGCLDGDWNADHDAVFGEFGTDDVDLWSEVYVGRLTTRSNAEVNVMVNKIKNYERPMHTVYPKKILLLSEVLFPSNYQNGDPISQNGGDLSEYVRLSAMTAPGLTVTRLYQTPQFYPAGPGIGPSLLETRQASIDSINAGYNHVVHVGHGFRFNMSVGDASIVNADAAALTNGIKLANINMLNCTGAAFTYECLAEYFLRNPNGGAVSVVGSNDSAFPTVATEYMAEFYIQLFNQGVNHIGETFALSREPRTAYAEANDMGDRWTHFTYSLLADPEMPLWTAQVATLAVAHSSSVNKGTNMITVTVTSGGNPVENATVCLTKGNDDYEVGTTNASGQTTLSFRAESAGTIDVVVTGRNYKRSETTITVGGTGAYIAINTITIDDDNSGGTSGNGNGIIESGETVDFAFSMRNSGTATSGTVGVTLRDYDAGATVTDSTASGGTIAAGANGTMTGGCRVAFSSSLEDQHSVPFVLIIKNNGVDTWRDEFKKVAHTPELSMVKVRIDDTVTGNSNGIVEAGEQFKLYYRVKNFGTGTYPGGTLTAFDLDGAFTIGGGGTSPYVSIPSIGSVENTTGITLTESSVATEHRLRLRIVDTYGRAYEDTLELRQPSAPGAIAIDPSLGIDRLELTWAPSPSSDIAHYNVYRATSGGGPFTQVNVDPVAHTMYVNTGLNSTSTYYYKVTGIDVSGNESAQTIAYSGSTNPAQLQGFPIEMESETTSSVAVGDIDGNGGLEIVVGDKWVYAWHANGNEMIDGDANPLSWGVLSPQGSGFVSHIALAPIDGSGGLDIIAASRDTKQVFIFKYNGTVVSGWPQSTENFIRAGMVTGDINGDGILEIIGIDEFGVLYVWKKNGTEFRDGDSNPLTPGVFARLTNCNFNFSTPAVANIDSDSKNEIIVGTQGNQLHVFNDDGTSVTGFPLALADDIAGSPAVGDVDGNGDVEIVIAVKNGMVKAINHDGTELWSRTLFAWAPFFTPSPVLGDVTGDGRLETFIPAPNGKLYGLTYTSTDLPGFPTTYSASTYSESSPVIADIDGDGLRDIVIASEEKTIWAWNRNGVAVAGFPLATSDAMRGVPTVTDLDQDGSVDLVGAGWDKNVYVWDFAGTWNPSNAPWPRFHANLHNNGRVGFATPTPVIEAGFMFTVADDQINLEWSVPAEAGRLFDVERAELSAGTPGSFHRIAKAVGATVDGRVHVRDKDVEMGARYVYRLSGETGLVHESQGVYVPVSRAALGQNYPNPFNPVTKIEYWVPEGLGGKATVNVVVYDVRGARVKTLVTGAKNSGRYVAEWDGRNDTGSPVSSGVYFYRMTTTGFASTRKMLLLK